MLALIVLLLSILKANDAQQSTCCSSCESKLLTNAFYTINNRAKNYCLFLGCLNSCGIGTELTLPCNRIDPANSNLPQNYLCEACPYGKYRNDVNTQPSCQTCSPCGKGSIETVTCNGAADSVCTPCNAGYIKSSNQCFQCNSAISPQTFANPDTLASCDACTVCNTNQSWSTDCTSVSNRRCKDCSIGTMASAVNSASCNICASGYFRPQANAACILCATAGSTYSCGTQKYGLCTTNADGGQRTCAFCDGHSNSGSTKCNAGFGVSVVCDGTGSVNPTCQPCGPGYDRVSTSSYTDIQRCNKCGTGKYKAGTGSQACISCTVIASSNAAFAAWDVGQIAESNTCPW